jgi:hypothetical protein
LVWAGAFAASRATLAKREREATSNLISLPPTLYWDWGGIIDAEPPSRLERGGGMDLPMFWE